MGNHYLDPVTCHGDLELLELYVSLLSLSLVSIHPPLDSHLIPIHQPPKRGFTGPSTTPAFFVPHEYPSKKIHRGDLLKNLPHPTPCCVDSVFQFLI